MNESRRINSKVPVWLLNKEKVSGILEQMLSEIPYASLPKDMIDTITVDLADFSTGSAITVGELALFQNPETELQIPADTLIFRIRDRNRLR